MCLYFDQLRNKLDPELSVIDNLAEGREFIEINGKTASRYQLFAGLPVFASPGTTTGEVVVRGGAEPV
jgi:ABC transport system ATP-binding/permease protein